METINTNDNIVLENERVQLRPLQADDLQHLAHFAIEEPELWKYSLPPLTNLDGLKQYISKALLARSEGNSYPFIVYDKREKAYGGCTRFYDIQPINQTLQLGYTWYGSRFQRTGLNRNCKYLLLEFAFEKMDDGTGGI